MPPRSATGTGAPPLPSLWPAFLLRFPELLATCLPHHEAIVGLIASETVTHPGMPNLLLYGPRGFPLDLLYRHALQRRFGVFTARDLVYERTLPYRETPYTFELDFAHPNLPKDLSILPEFVKSIVSARCMHSSRHILLLRNVNALRDRQPFRVLLERFSQNALFICTTYSVSALESPLQSRFQHLRVPLPTAEETAAIFRALGAAPATETGPRLRFLKAIGLYDLTQRDPEAAVLAAHYAYPPIATFLARPKPTLEGIRQMAIKTFQANVPLARMAEDLVTYLTLHGKDKAAATAFLKGAAELEHAFVAGAARGRAPIYYERLLHLAVVRSL